MNRQYNPSQHNQAQRNPRGPQRGGREQQGRNDFRREEPDNFQQFADDMFDAREADRFPHGYSAARPAPWREPYRYGHPDAIPYSSGYSGQREASYGADQRYFDDYNNRDWDRDWQRQAARQDGRPGWRDNAYDDGSYLANPGRNPRYGGQHSWLGDEARRFAGMADGGTVSRLSGDRNGRPTEGQYGRQTPKGYTRSDDRIKDDVCEHLYHANDIDLSDVTIEARNGTLMLDGTVPDRRMKHRIEDIAEQCIGVSDVENRIRVKRESGAFQAEGGNAADERGARKPASPGGPAKH